MYQDNRRNQRKVCANPCDFTNVYFGPPVEELLPITGEDQASGLSSRLIVYFRTDVKVTSEYYLISWVSMVAEIGGYASLLLGFSLFNLTDVVDVSIDYFSHKWHNFMDMIRSVAVPK